MPDSPDNIFSTAEQRRQQLELAYAGAVLPDEAHALHAAAAAQIIDVRTAAELAYVGRVPDALFVEWQSYPTMEINAGFIEELQKLLNTNTPALFICRSGARSHFAADCAAKAGYRAYNILEGFEGDLNEDGHRNTINGWRARNLPWTQS